MSIHTLIFHCPCGHIETNVTPILDGTTTKTVKEYSGSDALCDKCHQESIKHWKFDANGNRIS